jgi:hypothetical protein
MTRDAVEPESYRWEGRDLAMIHRAILQEVFLEGGRCRMKPSPLLLRPLLACFPSPGEWMMMSVEQLVECLAGETKVLGENLSRCRFRPPQIPHDLTWARACAAALRNRQLTT